MSIDFQLPLLPLGGAEATLVRWLKQPGDRLAPGDPLLVVANDGVEVSLLWHKPTNRLFVSVHDTRSDELFELDVASDYALDAFEHPYAYAHSRGLRRQTVNA